MYGDLARAMANVNERRRLQEEAKKHREEEAAAKAEREAREREAAEKLAAAIQKAPEPLAPAVQAKPEKDPNELFPVVGPFVLRTVTRAQVIKFKQFLNQEGIKYGKP